MCKVLPFPAEEPEHNLHPERAPLHLWLLNSYLIFQVSILLLIIPGIICSTANGQIPNTCPNSDFSLGDFTGWDGYYGTFTNPALHHGFANKRHMIIQSPGNFDPRTCYELFTLPPGESHCAKLGNELNQGQAEQLRYTISVTEETNLFIYKYAVVLEKPAHEPQQQPSFSIEVTDASGTIIDPVCGYYYVYAQQGLPSWHICNNTEIPVVWKDWTTVGIDMTPYIGQTITIVFTTKDCSLNEHFGYAYISAYCSKLQIIYGFCPNDSVATVTAPPGFTYLWGNGDTTQTIIIPNPVFGAPDSCILTSANGCKVTTRGTFQPTILEAGFGFTPECLGTPVLFYDTSSINQSYVTKWLWDFGDGSPLVDSVQNPLHTYDTTGTFTVKLIAYSMEGCPDTITGTVRIAAIPVAVFTPAYTCSSKTTNDTIYFDQQVEIRVSEGCEHYAWNNGDSSSTILVTEEGWYKVTLDNNVICSVTDSVLLLHCYVPMYMPNAFSPNNDGHNDQFRPVSEIAKVSSFILTIYDYWGKQIFKTRDICQGWDGRIEGKPAPLGLYCYMIQFEHPSGDLETISGIVTLVR